MVIFLVEAGMRSDVSGHTRCGSARPMKFALYHSLSVRFSDPIEGNRPIKTAILEAAKERGKAELQRMAKEPEEYPSVYRKARHRRNLRRDRKLTPKSVQHWIRAVTSGCRWQMAQDRIEYGRSSSYRRNKGRILCQLIRREKNSPGSFTRCSNA
jgi:hypothetical protein